VIVMASRLDDQVSHIAKAKAKATPQSNLSFVSISVSTSAACLCNVFSRFCLPRQLRVTDLLSQRFEHSCRRDVTYLESSDQRSATNRMNLIILSSSDRQRASAGVSGCQRGL
jgi:hypothetical protein